MTARADEQTTAAVRICDCFKCGQPVYGGLVHYCPTALPLVRLSPLGGFYEFGAARA